jgi:hypothetical protein
MVLEKERTQVHEQTDPRVGGAGDDIREDEAARFMARLVRKRDGRVAPFDRSRIAHAVEMAVRAELGIPFPDPIAAVTAAQVDSIVTTVLAVLPVVDEGEVVATVEAIQDEVERALMAAGAFAVARRYILYREARARRREEQALRLRDADGQEVLLNLALLRSWIAEACAGYEDRVSAKAIAEEVLAGLPAGAPLADLERSIVLAARTRIESDPADSFVAARALLRGLYAEALGRRVGIDEIGVAYPLAFAEYVWCGVELELLAPEMLDFDLERLGAALAPERDLAFQYLGLQTLYDRYLIHHGGRRIELPQMLWMRVAMGLALQEDDREERAIAFYDLISSFRFCPSTPTLFNAGTRYPQLSSCYLSTVGDDLGEIFKTMRDNALLSKWSGGIGKIGLQCAPSAATSRAPTAPARASSPSSRSPMTPPSRSIRVESARERSAPTSKPGTSTSRSSLTCVRTPATTVAAPTICTPHCGSPTSSYNGWRLTAPGRSSARATSPICTTSMALPSPGATPSTKPRSTGARSPTPNGCARSISGGRC